MARNTIEWIKPNKKGCVSLPFETNVVIRISIRMVYIGRHHDRTSLQKKRRIDPVFSSISMGLVGGGGGWQKKRARFYVQGFSFFVELPINTTMEKTIYDFSCHVFRRVARSFSKKKQFFLFKTRKSGRRRKKRMHQPNGKRMRPSKNEKLSIRAKMSCNLWFISPPTKRPICSIDMSKRPSPKRLEVSHTWRRRRRWGWLMLYTDGHLLFLFFFLFEKGGEGILIGHPRHPISCTVCNL